MTFDLTAIVIAILFCLSVSILLTRMWARRRDQKLIADRLSSAFESAVTAEHNLIKAQLKVENPDVGFSLLRKIPGYTNVDRFVLEAGVSLSTEELLLISCCLLLAPSTVAMLAGSTAEAFLPVGLLLCSVPWFVLWALKAARLNKFHQQLPDAIDLMVSILRSGHSLPQAVKSVADDMPAPCGTEFALITHRMSLGQSLPTALYSTVERLQSFEIDLIRRATAIQLEVGGSLSDLLEKTNGTLRQRLKLKRQVKVLTAQSRLTGIIVGLMPFVIAAVFSLFNPNYLQPLLTTNLGKGLLSLAVMMQIIGFLVMRKLSTFKV